MALVVVSDFTDKYKLAVNNFTTTDLQAYITKYEKRYLQDLLGIDLYNLFIASYSSGLPTGIYLTLYNDFAFDNATFGYGFTPLGSDVTIIEGNNTQKIIRSEGIKEMLKGFIFWEYSRKQKVKNTTTGNVEETNENSNSLSSLRAFIDANYNEAITSYNAIQEYIRQNLSVYPDFNGLSKSYNYL
jgi:hypothetical protein